MLYDLLIAPFEFDFMRRALVGAVALACGAAPVGTFLMLRRMSLTGDAMSHAILPGVAAGFLVSGLDLYAMTAGGLVAGVVVAVAAGALTRMSELKEDAALAAFYLVALAAGVALVSVRGSNVDLFHILFGSVLALDDATLVLLASVATLSLVGMAAIWRPLVMECVDPVFLRTVSRAGGPVHLVFLALVVLNLVAAFHALGTLLAVGLMMLPAVAARFWARELTAMTAVAIVAGGTASYGGLIISFHTALPSGAVIILVAGALCAASALFGPVGGLSRRLWPARHLEA